MENKNAQPQPQPYSRTQTPMHQRCENLNALKIWKFESFQKEGPYRDQARRHLARHNFRQWPCLKSYSESSWDAVSSHRLPRGRGEDQGIEQLDEHLPRSLFIHTWNLRQIVSRRKAEAFSRSLLRCFRFELSVERSSLRTPVNNIEYFPPNFEGLVLGCIDADFCKYILVGKLSPRSTQCTPLHRSLISIFSSKIANFFLRLN